MLIDRVSFTSAWSKMESLSQPLSTDPSNHRKELGEHLDILRRNENFCDVKITVKGKEFTAHRAVLAAASPFFLTLLTSNMRESNEQLIRIKLEEATESVMEDVLKYIYTGNVSVTKERAHNLIATAEYLLLPSLKTMASNFLKAIVTIENCVSNYYFADKYQCVELKEKCCEVINSNFSVVMETDDFLNLDAHQVMEWVSSDDVTVNAEEEVFKGIVKWVSHNKSEREGDFPELLHQVRQVSLSHDVLLNELAKEELITKNAEFGLNFVVEAMKFILSATDGQVTQQPRKCLETHTDAIFVCGGRKALCYLPKQNIWYRLADTPFEYQNHTLTQCKSKIYIVDGQTHKLGESQVIEFYVPLTNSWGAIQRDAIETNFSCCTVLKGHLYATHFSCYDEGGIYRYDTEMNCWEQLAAPPTQQLYSCVVADEQFLYIIGGTNDYGASALSTTTRFDSNNNKWEYIAPINKGKYNASGAVLDDKIFLAGGQLSKKTYDLSCEIYSPTTNEWHLMPSLKTPRFNASIVGFEGSLYVLGGYTVQSGRYIRALTVDMFDSERNEWTEISAVPVKSFETTQEENKKNKFQACFARLHKGVIDKLQPLN